MFKTKSFKHANNTNLCMHNGLHNVDYNLVHTMPDLRCAKTLEKKVVHISGA